MIVGIVGHVAEQDPGGRCHMSVFVKVAATATALCKSHANMCHIFYPYLCCSLCTFIEYNVVEGIPAIVGGKC